MPRFATRYLGISCAQAQPISSLTTDCAVDDVGGLVIRIAYCWFPTDKATLQHVCSHVYVNIFYGVFPFMDDKYSLLTNALGQTQVFEISFGGDVFYTSRSLQVFRDRNEYIFCNKMKTFRVVNKSRPY